MVLESEVGMGSTFFFTLPKKSPKEIDYPGVYQYTFPMSKIKKTCLLIRVFCPV